MEQIREQKCRAAYAVISDEMFHGKVIIFSNSDEQKTAQGVERSRNDEKMTGEVFFHQQWRYMVPQTSTILTFAEFTYCEFIARTKANN